MGILCRAFLEGHSSTRDIILELDNSFKVDGYFLGRDISRKKLMFWPQD